MWKKTHSESSKKWRYGVIFEWKRLIFLHTECDFFLTCFIDFYRPFKSGAHSRSLSTQNPVESTNSSDLSKKQKDFLLHSSLFRGRGVVLPKEKPRGTQPASECRPTRAGDLARELAGESWLAGWLAGWVGGWLAGELAGELGLASPKNLAIFSIFGDFLLRSRLIWWCFSKSGFSASRREATFWKASSN